MTLTRITVCLIALLASAATQVVKGAAVTGVHLEDGKAKIFILNQSGQPITYWMVRLKEHLNDGRENNYHTYGQDVEIAPGSTTEAQITENADVALVESAEVIFAMYVDKTAQVKEGEEQAVEMWKKTRLARANQLLESAQKHPELAEKLKREAQRLTSSVDFRRVP